MVKKGRDEKSLPKYVQLQSLIREYISAGRWQPGAAIPAEQALGQQFAMARMTVRQALDGLVREGLLVRIRGNGTFVTTPRVERELTRLRGFSEDMQARGLMPTARVLARQVIPAPDEVSAHLSISPREAVIYLQRLRLADGLPMALDTAYLNYALCHSVLGADLNMGSLYHFLEHIAGLRLCHGSQELRATLPNRIEAELLEMPRRQPVLIIHQTTYVCADDHERPAIRGQTVYRADRYRFRLEVPR